MNPACRRWLRGCALAASWLGGGAATLAADEPPIQVNPNRPTFATPALTTEIGVAELELGLQRSQLREGGSLSWSPFLLKLGLLDRLELRIGGNGIARLAPPDGSSATGFGDVTLGVQWCYRKNGPLGLDLAAQLTAKLPTASADQGLGSGQWDETLMLLFSRDLGPFHLDVNGLETWQGQPAGGRERQAAGTVCLGRTLGRHWSLTGELYAIGATSLGPRIVSNLWAFGYKVSPSLVLDGGVDLGLSHGAQRIAFFAGLTSGLFRFRHPASR